MQRQQDNKATQFAKKFYCLTLSWKWSLAILVIISVVVGSLISARFYDDYLDPGDQSTFYSFANNIAKGEVIYKDFIHFRTPGSYFLWAGFIKVFGSEQSSLTFALQTEAKVLYSIVFAVSAVLILRALKRRNILLYGLISLLAVLALPAYLQLRAGFAFLAIALYLSAINASPKQQNKWLFGSGLAVAMSFIFGQEMAIVAGLTIAASEFIWGKRLQKIWSRLKYFAGGVVAGLLPLLVYILLFSSLGTFIYYTTYYALLRQPRFMDIPFPVFGYETIVYFLPFVIYLLCFSVLYFNRKLGQKEAVLLSFGLLRLVTVLGRSDIGHLIFSIPELFLIAPIFIISSKNSRFNRSLARRFLPYFAILSLTVVLSMYVKSVFMIIAPITIYVAIARRPSKKQATTTSEGFSINLYAALVTCLVLFTYLIAPLMKTTAITLKKQLFQNISSNQKIGGVGVPGDNYAQYADIREVVKKIDPTTIFSFPVQPLYYSLAPNHASKLLTFEPQVTLWEQDLTVTQLKESRPQVVVFDPQQAALHSRALWKISNYIMANYKVIFVSEKPSTLWVMVPKENTGQFLPLAFNVYREAEQTQAGVLNNKEAGIKNALLVSKSLTIPFENLKPGALKLSVRTDIPASGLAKCGQVVIIADKKRLSRKICEPDGRVAIPVPAAKEVEIYFNQDARRTVLWDNPAIISN